MKRTIGIVLGMMLMCMSLYATSQYSLRPDAKGTASRVTLQPFLADTANNTGIAIIVCPGGSYSWHDMETEGTDVARWLQNNGINAYVLAYRVATVGAYVTGYRVLGLGNKYPDMLEDVDDALKYVYEHAEQNHIDTTRIGVMGFSAGGHLAMASWAYNPTHHRPTFICAIYPVVTMCRKEYVHTRSRRGALGVWGQWNKSMQDSLSLERHISPNCPPVFLVNCEDDPVVRYENSVLLDSALTMSQVPHRYIRYATGGHGFGVSEEKGTEESRQWMDECLDWIKQVTRENGYVSKD